LAAGSRSNTAAMSSRADWKKPGIFDQIGTDAVGSACASFLRDSNRIVLR
jgi:hypothetical protein